MLNNKCSVNVQIKLYRLWTVVHFNHIHVHVCVHSLWELAVIVIMTENQDNWCALIIAMYESGRALHGANNMSSIWRFWWELVTWSIPTLCDLKALRRRTSRPVVHELRVVPDDGSGIMTVQSVHTCLRFLGVVHWSTVMDSGSVIPACYVIQDTCIHNYDHQDLYLS